MPLLTLAVTIPLAGAVLAAALPARLERAPERIALAASFLALACLLATWARFDPARGMQLVEEATWIPSLDVAWRLGVDGMALALSAMSAMLFVASAIYGVGPRPLTRAAAALLLLLEGATLAFFLAQDFFLFYVAFDVTLVAMYFLIALWGGERRRYAALKFFLYTLVGSLPVLLGIVALFLQSEPQTFDMIRLAEEEPFAGAGLGASLVFLAFLVGFAIKTPIVPFHTWLPAAHVEAPTAGSVLLAGVLLKLGTYGLVRVNLQMLGELGRGVGSGEHEPHAVGCDTPHEGDRPIPGALRGRGIEPRASEARAEHAHQVDTRLAEDAPVEVLELGRGQPAGVDQRIDVGVRHHAGAPAGDRLELTIGHGDPACAGSIGRGASRNSRAGGGKGKRSRPRRGARRDRRGDSKTRLRPTLVGADGGRLHHSVVTTGKGEAARHREPSACSGS